jgi:hypothetical protein
VNLASNNDMANTEIERDAMTILEVLSAAPRDVYVDRVEIAKTSDLPPHRVNDAMALLVDAGKAEWIQTFGTAPFDFNSAMITSRGRYERQRLQAALDGLRKAIVSTTPAASTAPSVVSTESLSMDFGIRPPVPVGSPFGFTDEDWETVSARKSDPQRLYTVLGHQFESSYFDSGVLRNNVETMLRLAVERYNQQRHGPAVVLEHRALNAGYGEHLFNEIARDIIGADIAVFETSDFNPNVMLEIGVALTWGIRVLPIKREDRPTPPSDVSGQTWANHRDSCREFVDPDHNQKLVRMIERALRKKARRTI